MSSSKIPSTSQQEAHLLAKARVLVERGFFDETYYAAQYSARPGEDLFEHFFFRGYRKGWSPNPFFDTRWYLSTYPDVALSDINPLLEYVAFGEKAGRDPSLLFDAQWYRERYKLEPTTSALLHYLQNWAGPFSPIPEFDADYYSAANPDVVYDPFAHYCQQGFREGRNPSASFDTRVYARRFLKNRTDVNPLVHHRIQRKELKFRVAVVKDTKTSFAEVKRFTRPGKDFVEFSAPPSRTAKRAKLLAFYLTQFHAIPENNAWWGMGFTEWTDVVRGQPRFKDHYQPRTPRDLGFYSLDDVGVMRRQAAMAKAAGVFGFVFSYYRFGGKRLLEKPLENFLAASDVDIPFCLLWDNENWTRRRKDGDLEVLIAQDYGLDDDEKLCADFARHFHDGRYIRVRGRPLLMINRPSFIENTAATIGNWRRIFHERFGENPMFVMAQNFDDFDPRAHGMDGAVEFPPHLLIRGQPTIGASVEMLDPAFDGDILAYDRVVAASLDEPASDFPLIKTIVPSWDDDPRRQGSGLSVHGSTPAKYEAWLAELVERADRRRFFGEAFVCINAWNRWAEGAYLEPDVHYGSAYLNATARALTGAPPQRRKPLLIGDDADAHGTS